ncbi:MAG: DUF1684 domain-containing protein [Bacteroidota bacterium]
MDINSRETSTKIFIGIGIAFVAIILWQYYSLRNPSTYSLRLAQQRELKDRQFRNAPDSPIPSVERTRFAGLNYFAIDESYISSTTLVPAEKQDTLILMTSVGSIQKMIRKGKLQFELQGIPQELVAYQNLDESVNQLFVPFRDLTTNVSTYGGGRYLDIPQEEELKIDFNQAYNPYCVYNPDFVCPLPPPENYLSLEILAGERMPEGG